MMIARLCRRLLFVAGIFCAGWAPLQAQVVISQIYGGGGNAGSTFKNDFIEIFNAGAAPVSIHDWSAQFLGAAGSWSLTNVSGVLQPGQYYLIQQGQGPLGEGAPLPTPDATGAINLSSTTGKVALVRNQVTLTDLFCSIASSVEDFVGYGSANCSETAPALAGSNTLALIRAQGGCTDSGNNSADFVTATPNPRNTASQANPCGGGKKVRAQIVAD